MTVKTLQAWVIHKYWSGDTSARVYFFSRELGLINCLCRGGRTPKKQPLLQAFTPLWIGVNERYDHYFTQTIESIAPTLPLTGDALFSGLYINELLYYALSPLFPVPELFNAYLMILNQLTRASSRFEIEVLLRRFEWNLLHTCGHAFSLIEEANTKNLISRENKYQFVPGTGFILDNAGIPGDHILALAADNLTEIAYLKSAKKIMRLAIDHLLGGRIIKARALYS